MISSGAASFLAVSLAVFLADCLGSGDQLVNARLGDLQICGDFPDGIPLQFFHLERSRNAGVLRIHHGLDTLVLHFCSDLLIYDEINYYRAEKLTKKMLGDGLITADEYDRILAEIRKIFVPYLAEILLELSCLPSRSAALPATPLTA